jgi:hypothetical protein
MRRPLATNATTDAMLVRQPSISATYAPMLAPQMTHPVAVPKPALSMTARKLPGVGAAFIPVVLTRSGTSMRPSIVRQPASPRAMRNAANT